MNNPNFLAGCQTKGGLNTSTQVTRCFYLPREKNLPEKLRIEHRLVNESGVTTERLSIGLASGRECMEYWKTITKAIASFMMRAYNKDINKIVEILNDNARMALADTKKQNPTKQQTLEVKP